MYHTPVIADYVSFACGLEDEAEEGRARGRRTKRPNNDGQDGQMGPHAERKEGRQGNEGRSGVDGKLGNIEAWIGETGKEQGGIGKDENGSSDGIHHETRSAQHLSPQLDGGKHRFTKLQCLARMRRIYFEDPPWRYTPLHRAFEEAMIIPPTDPVGILRRTHAAFSIQWLEANVPNLKKAFGRLLAGCRRQGNHGFWTSPRAVVIGSYTSVSDLGFSEMYWTLQMNRPNAYHSPDGLCQLLKQVIICVNASEMCRCPSGLNLLTMGWDTTPDAEISVNAFEAAKINTRIHLGYSTIIDIHMHDFDDIIGGKQTIRLEESPTCSDSMFCPVVGYLGSLSFHTPLELEIGPSFLSLRSPERLREFMGCLGIYHFGKQDMQVDEASWCDAWRDWARELCEPIPDFERQPRQISIVKVTAPCSTCLC